MIGKEKGKNSEALLIVDYQQDFVQKSRVNIHDKIQTLADVFRKKELPVILTKFVNHKNTPFNKILHWTGMSEQEEQKLALEETASDKIITKDTYSALTVELKDYLEENQIDTIYLRGIDTDACILATAFALFDNGYKTCVVRDACTSSASSNSEQSHNVALQIIKRSIGNTTTTENVTQKFQ